LSDAGIPVTVLGKRWPVDPFAAAKLRKLLAQVRPDLVHTWLFEAGFHGRSLAKLLGIKRIVASMPRSTSMHRWQWTAERKLARITNRLVVNSAHLSKKFVAHGLLPDKISTISTGVPTEKPTNVSREELYRQLQLNTDARLIGVVGRLVPEKGVKELIWAAELVRVLHPNVHLLIIGDGPQRPTLEEFAVGASDLEHIRFLGERDDVWRILPHLEMLWHGSERESQSNAILEAMACGVPVVASDIPGNRELIAHGETGYLHRIGDRAGWARTTIALLTDPSLAQNIGEAGKRRMMEGFSIERMVEKYA
jgi:glycosyltransferase involved in cell wall biosynthesis